MSQAHEHPTYDVPYQDPPPGISPDEAVAEVRDVMDSIGDTCPECPPD